MKFFAIFFLILTAGCAGFWIGDKPGSGMVYPTAFFAVLGAGVMYRNWRKNGSAFSDSAGGR